MEELIKILQDVRDDVDFENTKDLIDGKVLTSFDIIQLITSLDDEYDISIPASEIVPANFNSAEAIYALIKRLQE
ncbi:MAG: acyl carrier protein [Lachnospiraceae bacterium]|nr:acyl carrier protein [Lachnospiraceae bacterium]